MTGLVEKKNRIGTRYYENEDGEFAAKECTGCGEAKVRGDFSKCKKSLGRRKSKCKSCERKYSEENRASRSENQRKYREENRVRIAELRRKKYRENRDSISEYYRKYREENRASFSERNRKYREENRDDILEKSRKYREENRVRIAEIRRKKYRENRDSILEQKRNYRKENPHVKAVMSHRRRARTFALPDTLTHKQLEEIADRFRGGCALTGCTDGIHLDHVIPLATGHGGTTLQNMIPLRADLNMSKNARCIFDWFYDVKDRFKLSQTKFDELIEYLAHINGMTADEYEGYVRGCHDNQRVLDETILDETESAG